ncbi:DUF3854 domain-containing protein [uncultured Nostoc sp.]|uniref:DUF3854 domain-containing protein n=1 Tax=uncultured Nostoc sp. TaxID=340711 RepID=UPI0035CB0F8B
MSQIEIVEIIEQIKQEIEVDANGQAKASLWATARLAGVSDKAIGKALESANLEPSKLAQMLMQQTFDAANLTDWRTSGIPDTAIAIILEYYAYEAGRYCTKQARLVCRSFYRTLPYEYLLYSPKVSRRNDGRLRDRDLNKYQHIELGGWWCNGIDPLNNYAQMMWGCFKPDHPRRDRQKIHKFIKYEHPYREETRAFFLLVPNRIWVKVSLRCGIPITEEDLQHPGGFWHWVWRHNVPVTIVEGVKKAGALLTAGYAAIAIPGVNAGYRTPHDEYGNATCVEQSRNIGKPFLIPDLKYFATQGRQVNICFDQDNKPETVQRVRTAISRMGRLLVNEGCSLRVIDLPFGQEKGVDDFIVVKGQLAFDALYNTAVALELWEIKLFTLLTYPPAIALNQRFLGQLLVPEGEKLIILKAPKGTGKTE